VITDYTMPKMTGTDLAREIMQIRPDVPIILCTGFNERVSEESSREMGISALIMKPVSLRGIGELIRKVLKTRDH
jgi:CheY-like chemotaxis protein